MVTAVQHGEAPETPGASDFSKRYEEALGFAREAYGKHIAPTGEGTLDHAIAISTILSGLRSDAATQIAALLYGTTDADRSDHPVTKEVLAERFGNEIAEMVSGIVQLMRVTEMARARSDDQIGRAHV